MYNIFDTFQAEIDDMTSVQPQEGKVHCIDKKVPM